MALSVGAFEAKTHLSELLTRVEAGEVASSRALAAPPPTSPD